jgi:hypothetical protein
LLTNRVSSHALQICKSESEKLFKVIFQEKLLS